MRQSRFLRVALAFGIVFAMVISTLPLLTDHASGQGSSTIYVDVSNTSSIEDGTATNPYNTIQGGIDAACLDSSCLIADKLSPPRVDAGNPASDYSHEPKPNGSRISRGAYGNTLEATTTPPVEALLHQIQAEVIELRELSFLVFGKEVKWLLFLLFGCCPLDKYGKTGQASGGRYRKTGHLTVAGKRWFSPASELQKVVKTGLSDSTSFQAGYYRFGPQKPLLQKGDCNPQLQRHPSSPPARKGLRIDHFTRGDGSSGRWRETGCYSEVAWGDL